MQNEAKRNLIPWIPTVRTKLFVFLCAVSLIPLLLATRVLISLGGRSARTLEEQQVHEGLDQTMIAFNLAERRLKESAAAVSGWDELRDYLEKPTPGWPAARIESWAPQNYKLDYLAITDAVGHPLYQWHSRPELEPPILDSLISFSDSVSSGWLSTPQDLYLIARSNILCAGEKIGVLIFARQMTHWFLLEMRSKEGQDLAVYYGERLLATTDTSLTSPLSDPQDIFPNLISRHETYLYHATRQDRYVGFQALRNLRGLEVAALGWTCAETPANFVQESIDRILLSFGVPLLLLILLAALVLGIWIERPIRSLSHVMEMISRTGDLTSRVPVAGGGEIASLSKSFNHMLEQLGRQRDELMTFRTMILTMREGVLIEDQERRIIYMNPRMEELLGIPFDTRWQEETPAMVIDRITPRRLISQDERGFTIEEVVWQRPDGQRVQALKTTGHLEDPAGKATGTLSTFVDVTERNELELELIQASRMAFLGVYSQGIIHNLNGPLNTILGFSALLCRNHPKAELPQRIQRDAQRMADLISTLAHRWQRTGDAQLEDLNLNEIIEEELCFLDADLFFKHNVEKQLNLDPDLPRIHGVYGDFSHALLNILINSIEALMESPVHTLSVRTCRAHDEVQVEISDTGVGIPPEDLKRIFMPFFSTKIRDRKDGIPSGAGLGLSLARKILEPYGVRFEVHSQERQGTTMILHIPIQREQRKRIMAEETCVTPA